jgi:hypothetical protein
VSIQTPDNPRIEAATVHLTPGKLNAVRAAFETGVKPAQIARQFGLSQSDVRQALASDAPEASRRSGTRAGPRPDGGNWAGQGLPRAAWEARGALPRIG